MGKDVVYVTLHPDLSGKLFRYTIHDVADPDQDTWELVGIKHAAYTGKGTGAFDASRNVYVRSIGGDRAKGFLAWDLSKAGPTNTSVRISAARTLQRVPDRRPADPAAWTTTACAGPSQSGARGVTSGT